MNLIAYLLVSDMRLYIDTQLNIPNTYANIVLPRPVKCLMGFLGDHLLRRQEDVGKTSYSVPAQTSKLQ